MGNRQSGRPPLTWAYGVTTVPSRKDTLLAQTLHSLCDAGFGEPRLFVDGCDNPREYDVFKRPVSCRPNPPMKIVGNWILGMWELYVRNPAVNRYAMFQDDILCVQNLREYLNQCPYPNKGYLNLYTNSLNEKHTNGQDGWHPAIQKGLGALGLVFDRETLQTLLSSMVLIRKPAAAGRNKSWKSLDGGVIESMKNAKCKEYIHNPSLLQHVGTTSTLGNVHYPPIEGFPGVHWLPDVEDAI